MSTFLQLCQIAAEETGVSTTGPSDTTSQTGRLKQIVHWVNRAWMDVQTKRNDWRWMVGNFTVNTTAGVRKYAYTDCTDTATSAAIAAFRDWRRHSLKIYLTSSGQGTETQLPFMDYRLWHATWNVGTPGVSTTRLYPRSYTTDHDLGILLGGYPNDVYTISGQFMKQATELSGDSDTPELPAEYHSIIVYRAMMKYGSYMAASEVYSRGEAEYKRMLRELIRTQTLPPLVGSSLT